MTEKILKRCADTALWLLLVAMGVLVVALLSGSRWLAGLALIFLSVAVGSLFLLTITYGLLSIFRHWSENRNYKNKPPNTP